MRHDYSRRYSGAVNAKQQIAGRSFAKKNGKLLKLMGLIVTVAMLVGIAVSIWFGWAIRASLDGLAQESAVHRELTARNRTLSAQRDALLGKEKIEAAAMKLGLFPPSKKQIRRP